ncbi:hypothetical protein V5799_012039 [Amblyomma americanum]|uniref:Uncharacterized protein n=1 Tax=Amblyomma americanum TaxID=6943 RepID=A0AAQ4EFM2_AMBAM
MQASAYLREGGDRWCTRERADESKNRGVYKLAPTPRQESEFHQEPPEEYQHHEHPRRLRRPHCLRLRRWLRLRRLRRIRLWPRPRPRRRCSRQDRLLREEARR